MKRFLFLLCLALLSITSRASIVTKQFTLQFYGTYNVVIYTPDNTQGLLPAFIFFPGSGESNTNPADLYVNGPLNFIQSGWTPDFIVIGVQPLNGGPGPNTFVQNALDSLLNNPSYRIDPNRWYLTGLSYGAATLFNYIQTEPDSNFRYPAAIIPMSYVIDAECGIWYQGTGYLCGTDFRFKNIPAWGFCGNDDAFYGQMSLYFQTLDTAGYNVIFTTLNGQGHCCWNTNYNPSYTFNGLNIYQWALQYSSTSIDLPILLLSFQGIRVDAVTELSWSTATESNNSYFSVERSTDGVTFQDVGQVPTKAINGNSSTQLNYTFNYK